MSQSNMQNALQKGNKNFFLNKDLNPVYILNSANAWWVRGPQLVEPLFSKLEESASECWSVHGCVIKAIPILIPIPGKLSINELIDIDYVKLIEKLI